jgi:HEPN domain-containing protein
MALADNNVAVSKQLVRQAEIELDRGNKELAAEKAAEAVHCQLKSIAERRGWKHGWHIHNFKIVDKLSKEIARPEEFRKLYTPATSLRFSLYNELKTTHQMRWEIDRVKEFLAMLEEVE